jgi:uroporphyrin-III C-methyltransferase
MGMSKLEEIVAIFQNESKGETAVAIIQNGTTQKKKSELGPSINYSKIVTEQQIVCQQLL